MGVEIVGGRPGGSTLGTLQHQYEARIQVLILGREVCPGDRIVAGDVRRSPRAPGSTADVPVSRGERRAVRSRDGGGMARLLA